MQINQRKAGVMLSYLSEGVRILTGLVYTPIMLRILGQSEYGLYQLVYSVVSYLGLLSLGFGSSYMKFYSSFKKKDDNKGIAKLNGMFLSIFILISGICILCGVVMIGNVKAIFDTGLMASEIPKAKLLMGLMVFNLALTFPNSVFNCYTSAHEKFFFQKLLVIAGNVLNPFFTLRFLLLGYGSVGMVGITTLITVIQLGVNIWFCFAKLKMEFLFRGFDFSLLKEMWVFTFFIFINQIIDQINWSVDKFLLGRFIGTTAVAIYGLGSQLNTMYLQFSVSISNVFVPRINRIVTESDDNEELSNLFTKIGRIQFLILALILSGFIIFGQSFLEYWGGTGYSNSYYVALILMIPVSIPLIQNLGIEIQRAKNKHKMRSFVYLCIAIGNVFISIPLIQSMGEIGATIGTAISLIMGNILFMNWYYQKKIGLDMVHFWKEIIQFIPALIPCAVFGVLTLNFVVIDSILKLIFGILIYTIVYGVSMWFFGMNQYEKKLVLPILQKVLHKK